MLTSKLSRWALLAAVAALSFGFSQAKADEGPAPYQDNQNYIADKGDHHKGHGGWHGHKDWGRHGGWNNNYYWGGGFGWGYPSYGYGNYYYPYNNYYYSYPSYGYSYSYPYYYNSYPSAGVGVYLY